MPIFEFQCRDCNNQFTLLISNADKNKAKCPQCNSGNVRQLLSLFSTGRGSKSNSADNCFSCPQRTKG